MAKVVFHSRYTEHELIRVPKHQTPLPMGGGWQTVQQRLSYQFHAAPAPDLQGGLIGVLEVQTGRNKLIDGDGWLRDGEESRERDDVDALRAHRAFGQDFWESGHGPGTLYPRPVDFRADLMAAVAELDEERLVAMLAEEKGSHNRRDLIADTDAALGSVRGARAALEAQAAAEEAKAAKAPKAKATA